MDSLLQLTGEEQFRNCFDKAVLMMVKKSMDVKELVNSSLFFAPAWSDQIIHSDI